MLFDLFLQSGRASPQLTCKEIRARGSRCLRRARTTEWGNAALVLLDEPSEGIRAGYRGTDGPRDLGSVENPRGSIGAFGPEQEHCCAPVGRMWL